MAKNGRLATPFCDPKGRYFVRRRVPKDLRTLFKGEFVQKSLATRNPAEAANRFPSLNAQIDAEFEQKRQALVGWFIGDAEQPGRPRVRYRQLPLCRNGADEGAGKRGA